MIALISESKADVEAVGEIVRRLLPTNVGLVKKGYNGKSEMMNKITPLIPTLQLRGVSHFIICRDADTTDKKQIKSVYADMRRLLKSINIERECCVLLPVQEIEAWILADEIAIQRVLSSLRIKPVKNPETVEDPKEYLIRQSRVHSKPRYIPTIHNTRVAQKADLDVLYRKCPSFRPLKNFCESF